MHSWRCTNLAPLQLRRKQPDGGPWRLVRQTPANRQALVHPPIGEQNFPARQESRAIRTRKLINSNYDHPILRSTIQSRPPQIHRHNVGIYSSTIGDTSMPAHCTKATLPIITMSTHHLTAVTNKAEEMPEYRCRAGFESQDFDDSRSDIPVDSA